MGKTDAIAMQHDVDYSVCKDDKKCKHRADKKMVKALDKIPYNERQWGHWLARNVINTKQRWAQRLAEELHKPIKRNFKKREVISNGIDEIGNLRSTTTS